MIVTDKKTILIIDDEPDTVSYFKGLLEDNGYATVTAENGEKGLAKVGDSIPDQITLDVTMPEMSGVKFYKTMRDDEKYKNVPIIFITGVSHDFKSFISSRKQVPAPDGYIAKPIDKKKLLQLVGDLIGVPAK